MRKLGITLFAFLLLFAATLALLQSHFVKEYTKERLLSTLQESGLIVKVGAMKGTLPFRLEFENVSIKDPDVLDMEVQIESLKVRISLIRLLKKELFLEHIQASQALLKTADTSFLFDLAGRLRIDRKKGSLRAAVLYEGVEWKVSSRFKINPDQSLSFSPFVVKSDFLNLKGRAEVDSSFTLQRANFQVGSDYLLKMLPIEAAGRVLGNLTIVADKGQFTLRMKGKIPRLKVEEHSFESVAGTFSGLWKNHSLSGAATLTANYLESLWEAKTDLSWSPGNSLFTPNLTLSAPNLKANANLEWTPRLTLLGESAIDAESLNALSLSDLFGQLRGKAIWSEVDSHQAVQFDATVQNLFFGSLFAEKGTLYSNLIFPLSGPLSLQLEKTKWNDLFLENINLETALNSDRSPFTLSLEGKWKHPLEITASGFWKGGDALTVQLEEMKGEFFNRALSLNAPLSCLYSKERFQMPNLDLSLSSASLLASIDRKQDATEAELQLKDLPLELLALSDFDSSVEGTVSLNAKLSEIKGNLRGDFEATVVQSEGRGGSFEGHLERDQLDLQAKAPSLDFAISLPVHLSIWPFTAAFEMDRSVKGHLTLNGQISDYLDFLDLGPHRFGGHCLCDLQLSHTLAHPHLFGSFRLTEGTYQNDYTGIELQKISADLKAEKNRVDLIALTATDGDGKGDLRATGQLVLDEDKLFPFTLSASFNDLRFAQIDLITASADGKIQIEGDRTAALVKGDVKVVQSQISIPDHIAPTIPDLQVTYRNQTRPIDEVLPNYKPYPLHLDLHVTTPGGIAINGRGLDSEWKGDFQVGGTFTEMATSGKLELISGEFLFSSKEFKLTEGFLSLSGKAQEMPYLNIAGTMETKGIVITARLKGPIDSPQLTFQSVPPLSMGSIVSYLLFGQDVAEISGFQALQLAASLAKIAGDGSDVIESTRRSLGVDRLRIVTNSTDDGNETLAIQVGKYVAEGFLVSFTQGVDESAPNISVEIELKNNFVFQIESMQQQEQGKFTLKWNLNY